MMKTTDPSSLDPQQAATLTHSVVRPSTRSASMTYAIRDILKVAREAEAAGKRLLKLNIGDPILYDFQTPAHMIEAVHQAMLAGHNGYAPSLGVPEAVKAIRKEAAQQGIRNVQEVFITYGVSEAIEIAIAALLDTGENVLIPSPGYPLFEATLDKLGYEPVPYYLDEGNQWQPDLDDMARRINARTRAIVVLNPNNPTGSVCSRETLQGIVNLAARHGLVLFCDEIYNKLLLDPGESIALASLGSEVPVVTFNGLSKSYLVPGFRVGWGILSGEENSVAEYREAITKMLSVRLCTNQPSQYAIRPALEGDQSHIAGALEKLRRRRDLTVSILNSVPSIHCVTPRAAFYAYPRLEIGATDDQFVRGLIRETGVIVVPGSGFGQTPGTRHFRLVFLPPEETLEPALRSIAAFAANWQ